MLRSAAIVLCLVAVAFIVAGCAPGPNRLGGVPDESGHVSGFLSGFWHGFISLFTFIVSLFNPTVRVYEVHNSGSLYDLGFILGVVVFFGGSGGGAGTRAKRGRRTA